MCGIIETRLNKKAVSPACKYLMENWNWECNSVECSRGCRIIVGWDPNTFSATLLSKSDQVMHFLVAAVTDGKIIYVSFVYGENVDKDRVALWKNLDDHNT
ncbi:hypothetical protein Tco_0384684, partial [Tanacetum coccineum]